MSMTVTTEWNDSIRPGTVVVFTRHIRYKWAGHLPGLYTGNIGIIVSTLSPSLLIHLPFSSVFSQTADGYHFPGKYDDYLHILQYRLL